MGRLSGATRGVSLLGALALVVDLALGVFLAPAGAVIGQAVAPNASAAAAAPASPAGSGESLPDVVFDAPLARGDLGEDIVFETTFRAAEPPRRVELVRGAVDDAVLDVSFAAFEPTGPDTWRARVVQRGHVAPNTAYRYHFRAVTADGRHIVGPEGWHRVGDTRFEWRRLSGNDVTVWWYEGDEAFARRALEVAEEAVGTASELFGVTSLRPVDFFIYADDRAFRQALGPATRENVGGEAHPSIDTLFGLIGPHQVDSAWVSELVAHELAHLVFDEATQNPYGYPPRWLNEGLAVHLSRGIDAGDRDQVAAAARTGSIIPLEGLVSQFPTRPNRFGLAYAESVSAVDHFVARYGNERLRTLLRSLASGQSLDEAFEGSTGEGFEAFEDDWLAAVGAQRGEPYGPQPAPPGPRS